MVRPLFSARTKAAIRDVVNSAVAAMPSTVTVRHKSGHDRYGDTFDDPVTYTAMLTYQETLVANGEGQQVVSGGNLVFPFPAPVIGVEDEITLADGTKPAIKSVAHDETGDPMRPTQVFF